MKCFRLFMLFLIVFAVFGSGICQDYRQEVSMARLRDRLGIDPRVWPNTTISCYWKGIKCDGNLQVISVNVSGLPLLVNKINAPKMDIFLPNLRYFNASGFSISDFFNEIRKFETLEVLDLQNSSLQSRIPYWLGRFSNLSYLNLAFNKISGKIPDIFAKLGRLENLKMAGNHLEGSIPKSIGSASSLGYLDLSGNIISSEIPQSLWSLSVLSYLDLSKNNISGELSPGIGRLSDLRFLNLEHNCVTGSIPRGIKGCANLEVLKLDHNFLSGHLPSEIGYLKNLQTMFLAFNTLSGTLPSDLTELKSIKILDLAFNRFYGSLPAGITEMHSLILMDLRMNFFNGPVPAFSLLEVRLSRNCFSNASRQHVQSTCEAFYSGMNGSGLTAQSRNENKGCKALKRERVKNMAAIMGGAIGGLAFILAVGTLVICIQGRRARSIAADGRPEDSPVSERFTDSTFLGQSFSYDQLMEATQKFDRSCFIRSGHSGDFFKGSLPSGVQIVVKRIDLSRIKSELYIRELEVLGRASHPGLVPLIGHCLQRADEKFLVYKFMPNGDLETVMRWKMTPGSRDLLVHPLDWIARLKIAIGIADVLNYLHHTCSPSIVHRDIKASSILLDDKFEVRLGSLSSATSSYGDPQPSLVARLLSISPYWEQGDASTSSSSVSYDVYCFGKVLLEIISGKTNTMEGSTESSWMEYALSLINIHDKESLPRIVDPYLIVDEDLLEEVWAVSVIAKACLNPRPSKRPTMHHVLKALQNPRKIVRSDMLHNNPATRTSSHSSWNEAFGSWRSSSASQHHHQVIVPGSLREEYLSRLSSKGRSLGATHFRPAEPPDDDPESATAP